MPEERICQFCGRANVASQPRCIGCGQRASGTVLLSAEEAKSTPQWWHSPPPSGPSIPPPPQVQEQINRAAAERAAIEARLADEAKRREETARRIAEARERLAERHRQLVPPPVVRPAPPPVTAKVVAHSCGRCQTPLEEGFSFCLHCGADSRVALAPPGSAPPVGAYVAEKNQSAVHMAQTTTGHVREREAVRTQQHTVSTTVTEMPRGTIAPGVAAILSFFVPGVGQFANGQFAKGMMLMLASFVVMSVLHWPMWGLAMLVGRMIAAIDACRIAERRRSGKLVRDGEWDLG